MGRKWFRIFLIRWRWLLKYLKILLFVAIWFGNDCFRYFATNWDLLSGLVVDEIFWFGYPFQNINLNFFCLYTFSVLSDIFFQIVKYQNMESFTFTSSLWYI